MHMYLCMFNILPTDALYLYLTLICGSVVVPLGEKAGPLEKDKASGASKDWS